MSFSLGNQFKKLHSFEKRKKEADRILEKYPEKIPVIVQKALNNTLLPEIDKNKYLVPKDLSIGQFSYVIRKRIKLKPEDALFISIENTIPPTSSILLQIYEEYKDKDGFLYVEISGESTFG